MKLTNAIDLFLTNKVGIYAPKTIDWYRKRLPDLTETIGDKELKDITEADLIRWRVDLFSRDQKYKDHPFRHGPTDGHLSIAYIHQHLRASKTFFRWLYRNGYMDNNPAADLELPKLPDYKPRGLRITDRDKIIDSARQSPKNLNKIRDYAITLFLADTGCRVGGLANLTLDDLDLDTGCAMVHEKGPGGSGKTRAVFFTAVTYTALIDWLRIRPHGDTDHVFLTYRKPYRGLKPEAISQIIKRAALRAGVKKGYNPHNWRHGAIRAWLNDGMSLPAASQLAGHSSVTVTGDIYGIVSETQLKKDHAKHSWLNHQSLES